MRPGSWAHRHLPTFAAAASWVGERLRAAANGMRYGAVAFAGAVSNRLTADWILAPITSADQELRADFRTLRARAREIARNDAHGSRHLDLLEENIVGPFGVTLQALVKTGDEQRDREINRAIEDAWWEWSKPENCSVDGRLHRIDVEDLAVRCRSQDGEALIRIIEGFDNPFGFALQVLDPDQLDHTLDRARTDDQNEIRMGVEIDDWGRPLWYHIHPSHPYDYLGRRGQTKPLRIPAREIIHLVKVKRPGQTRGVTDFAPVMMDLRMLRGLREAELVASRVAAAKGGFFTRPAEMTPAPDGIRGSGRTVKLPVEPGVFDELPAGYDFVEYNPTHPNSAFGEFCKGILKTIATGLRNAYAALTGDLTEVSFSSIRKGDLAERDAYRKEQWWLIYHFHERIYPRWLRWALTSGQLQLPSMRVSDWIAHEWMPRGWDWVDPLKDLLAAELAIALGLDDRTTIAASRGRDFGDVIANQAREQKLAGDAGVDITNGRSSEGPASAVARRLIERETDDPELRALLRVLERRAALAQPNGNGRKNGHPAP